MAGRKFGKTRLMIYSVLKACEKPNARAWYVAPFKNQAKEIAWLDFLQLIPPGIIEKVHENDLIITLKNNSRITIKGADKDNLRGPNLDFIGVDEAQDLRPEVFGSVLRQMVIATDGKCLLIGTKKEKHNWFRNEWIKVKRGLIPNSESFYFPCWANYTIPKESWDNERLSVPKWIWDREYISDPDSSDGETVGVKFPEFDVRTHVVAPFQIPKDWKHYRGMDWGMYHPTTCVWLAVDPKGTAYIYDEYSQGDLPPEAQARNILAKTSKEISFQATVLDPKCWARESDNNTIAYKFINAGLRVTPGRREDTSYFGASIVKGYLSPAGGKPKLYLFSNVTRLAEELTSLKWDDKTGDDMSDAARYILVFLNSVSPSSVVETKKNGWFADGDFLVYYKDGEMKEIKPRKVETRYGISIDEYGTPI